LPRWCLRASCRYRACRPVRPGLDPVHLGHHRPRQGRRPDTPQPDDRAALHAAFRRDGAAPHGRQIWHGARSLDGACPAAGGAAGLSAVSYLRAGLCLPLAAFRGLQNCHHAPLGCARGRALIKDEGITMFTGVPTMLWDVLHNAKLSGCGPVWPAQCGERRAGAAGQPAGGNSRGLPAGRDGHRLWHDRMFGRDCAGGGR
jgi:hypothetical protein